ncbi:MULTISPECIES: KilA-N domain-containing protein [unclassified Moraxella]|uniref:KilA-N domain-containing protein n=1 Tax=unclassified Moraxella TaxID=2685852 RepID=UPI002B40CA1E|nr:MULTISPECIES: KilA-N domain-containing protein [unclassified Moraxella]
MTNLVISNQAISTHNGLFSLNDLHKVSGNDKNHQPSNFMANKQTQALIAELENENQIAYDTVIGKGKKQGTYACRELVYAYAMWISAKFSLMVIRAFDAMNTGAIPCLAQPTISPAQRYQIQKAIKQKCLNNKVHYQTIYNALYDAFGVASYKDLLASEFENAMAFIESFSFTLAESQALYEVLADNAMHLRDYLKMLKVLKGLPITCETMGRNTFEQVADSYNAIIALANQLGLTNRYNQPMFAQGRINFYNGGALITR